MRLILFLLALCVPAFSMQSASGYCQKGGQVVVTGGVNSTTKVQQSFPTCTVTVYNAGTLVLATIYSDNSSTPLANPFTANSSAYWFFYGANATYTVQLSGGGLGSPLTLANILLNDPGISNVSANLVYAGPTSGSAAQPTFRSLVTADLPSITLAGDVTGGLASTVVAKVNGVSYGSSPSSHQVPIVGVYKTIPDCTDTTGNHLNFTQSTDAFSCGTGAGDFSGIGAGTNTNALVIGAGGSLDYGSTGTIDANKLAGSSILSLTGIIKMASGVPSVATAATDYVSPSVATAYTAGAKQTFLQSATVAGLNLGTLSADPSVPTQGDVWYNAGTMKYRDSGVTQSLLTTTSVGVFNQWFPGAQCTNATATSVWNLPAANLPAATCAGTSYRFANLTYDDAASETGSFQFVLPAAWTGAIDIDIRAYVNNTTQSFKATIATACIPASTTAINPTFNTAQTVTVTSPGTANQLFSFSQAGVTTTGCSAGNLLILKVGRDNSDTSTADLLIAGANLTYRETL